MFESAELGRSLSKEDYQREVPDLRQNLLSVQYALKDAGRFPVLVLINGVGGAGKGETVNLLHTWMDPRHIRTHAFSDPNDEERARPPMWRFWRVLPPAGSIGVFFGSWYSAPIVGRALGELKAGELEQSLDEIVGFERMLAHEGVLLLKFWFHLSREQQKRRLRHLEADPRTRWRVTDVERKNFKRYDVFRRVSEVVLRKTSTAEAPWIIVEGADPRYRSVAVGRAILGAVRGRLEAHNGQTPVRDTSPVVPSVDPTDPADRVALLRQLDLGLTMGAEEYQDALDEYQGRLNLLTRKKAFRKRSLVVVFEGCDAAGKGGAIRRVAEALDARQYHIVPVGAPSDEERRQPYLWRFWRHVPGRGRVTIFDRSWYGRVLVERVEGFCSEFDWRRAYFEINELEGQLVAHGAVVLKLWLQISKEEQLKRFEERQASPAKRYKITDEDWCNRDKWDAYELSVAEMIERTSTEIAPWVLVESNDKRHARIKVLRALCDRLEAEL